MHDSPNNPGTSMTTSDTPQRNSFPIFSMMGILLFHFIVMIALLFELIVVVPNYEAFFREIDIKMPVITQIVIASSNFTFKYFIFFAPFFYFVDMAIICLLSLLSPSKRWIRSLYSHMCILFGILLLVTINYGVGATLFGVKATDLGLPPPPTLEEIMRSIPKDTSN
jgi:hypothetical protein